MLTHKLLPLTCALGILLACHTPPDSTPDASEPPADAGNLPDASDLPDAGPVEKACVELPEPRELTLQPSLEGEPEIVWSSSIEKPVSFVRLVREFRGINANTAWEMTIFDVETGEYETAAAASPYETVGGPVVSTGGGSIRGGSWIGTRNGNFKVVEVQSSMPYYSMVAVQLPFPNELLAASPFGDVFLIDLLRGTAKWHVQEENVWGVGKNNDFSFSFGNTWVWSGQKIPKPALFSTARS